MREEQNVGGLSFSGRRTNLWQKLMRTLRGNGGAGTARFRRSPWTICAATRPISFIKLDIEGMELAALRGAHATIARSRPVIFFNKTPPTGWPKSTII